MLAAAQRSSTLTHPRTPELPSSSPMIIYSRAPHPFRTTPPFRHRRRSFNSSLYFFIPFPPFRRMYARMYVHQSRKQYTMQTRDLEKGISRSGKSYRDTRALPPTTTTHPTGPYKGNRRHGEDSRRPKGKVGKETGKRKA